MTGALPVALDCGFDGHVAVEFGVVGVRRPSGLHKLQKHGERAVREDCVEGVLHGFGTILDVLGTILVVVGLDGDDDVDVESAFDDHRDELDAAGSERSQLAVEAGGNDLLAGVLQQQQWGLVPTRELVLHDEGRCDEGVNHGHGFSSFLVVNRYLRGSACRSSLRTVYIIAQIL